MYIYMFVCSSCSSGYTCILEIVSINQIRLYCWMYQNWCCDCNLGFWAAQLNQCDLFQALVGYFYQIHSVFCFSLWITVFSLPDDLRKKPHLQPRCEASDKTLRYRWGNGVVMEGSARFGHSILWCTGMMTEKDKSTNGAAAVGFHPRLRWLHVVPSITRAVLCLTTQFFETPIMSQGELEEVQCCTAESQEERWPNVCVKNKPDNDKNMKHIQTHDSN